MPPIPSCCDRSARPGRVHAVPNPRPPNRLCWFGLTTRWMGSADSRVQLLSPTSFSLSFIRLIVVLVTMYAIWAFVALGGLPSVFAQQAVWGQCKFFPHLRCNKIDSKETQPDLTRRWYWLVRRQNMRIGQHMRSPKRLLLPMPTRHRSPNLNHPPDHHLLNPSL